MRVLTLTLSALGLAGFTAGAAVNNVVLSTSAYDAPPVTSLSRWLPSQPEPTQTRDLHNALVYRREEPSLTFPLTQACSSGSTKVLQHQQTSVCTVSKTAFPDTRSCATSWYAYYACAPTGSVSRTETGTNGGRSQRPVAEFAQATPQVPGCSFNLEQGVYICPTPTAPVCSFDRGKGQYVCNGANVASATPTPSKKLAARLCPPGTEMCDLPPTPTPKSSSASDYIHLSTTIPEWTATVPRLPESTTMAEFSSKIPVPRYCDLCELVINSCKQNCHEDKDCIGRCPCVTYKKFYYCWLCPRWAHECGFAAEKRIPMPTETSTMKTMRKA